MLRKATRSTGLLLTNVRCIVHSPQHLTNIGSLAGPLATLEGVQAPLISQGTGATIPKSPPPGLPPLTPQAKAKFARLFQTCGPVNGLINGMFVQSHITEVNWFLLFKVSKHATYSSNPNFRWTNYLKYGAQNIF